MRQRNVITMGTLILGLIAGILLLTAGPGSTQSGQAPDSTERVTIVDQADAVRNGAAERRIDSLEIDPDPIVRNTAPEFVLLGAIAGEPGFDVAQAQWVDDDNTAISIAWQQAPDAFDLATVYDMEPTEDDEYSGESKYVSTRVIEVWEEGDVQVLTLDNSGWSRQVITFDRAGNTLVNVRVTVTNRGAPELRVDDPYASGPDLKDMQRIAQDLSRELTRTE